MMSFKINVSKLLYFRSTALEVTGGTSDSKFPRIEECAHFHYENVDYGQLQVMIDFSKICTVYCISVIFSGLSCVFVFKWLLNNYLKYFNFYQYLIDLLFCISVKHSMQFKKFELMKSL